jgi:hypothetical protein
MGLLGPLGQEKNILQVWNAQLGRPLR